ncbi:PD-(D/E)XK nuclease superfamily protein [Maridesulfovibrio ferrireducens]|uniref:PD-(D/E)XK nuclease superfamily protein n=1 Tax=Maridesulfovibrio ferrireducens TaxID=246191 RepID=A0A1G9JV96_9BACT|nr:PD-(D/E)XK nuclease family protein [Maridesulfovibrio ferrireducens]SDL41135.1 PD-(D/E)XK nuclease superfamily protein [Maridesulfovibrio ferrireducens]
MTTRSPFTVISWKKDFIENFSSILIDESDGDLSNTIVIVPHHRPARYLKKALAASDDLPKPCILPEIYSFSDFVSSLMPKLTGTFPRRIGKLDQVGLLFNIIEGLRGESTGLLSKLPVDLQKFFPWGTRLASLLEEMLRQDVKPRNLSMLQGEVLDWAAALLEEIELIFIKYVEALERRGWSTTGLENRNLSQNLDKLDNILEGKKLYLAGFYGLSGVEDKFFHHLWDNLDLRIIWHSDPALALREQGHFAVKEHRNWMRNWKAEAVSDDISEDSCALPELKFFEGFDRHSQLCAMREELSTGSYEGCAVVLPDTSLLLPVMHHLPEHDINISMGYPLKRSALNGLLEAILKLQENKNGKTYYWKDILALIRHPYLKMLEINDEQPLRTIFHQWETVLRSGSPYADPKEFIPVYSDENGNLIDNSDTTEELRTEVLGLCIDGFAKITTLEELADSLQHMAEMLRLRGGTLWQRYLLDSECLFRLMNEVIPELRESSISEENFGQSLSFSIFRQLLSSQRVSFEPDPISSMQVLGMLESRLLNFKRTFILDTVDEKIPGTDPYDPLLPDQLRYLLDLPDSHERESVATYNFYRLIMGSEESCIFYQSGVQPGLLDSKSVRSRFVEQLLWKLEQKAKKIITPGENFPLKAINFPVGAILNIPEPIAKEPVAEKLEDMLKHKGLSPSAIDCYVTCPKLFFFRYLSNVRESATVDLDGDRAGFGELIHSVLKDFLTPHLGIEICGKDLNFSELNELFMMRLERDSLYPNLPYDIKKSLEHAGKNRLTLFLKNIGQTKVIALESDAQAILTLDKYPVKIHGRIDRVDSRDDSRYVIDYKTGQLHMPRKSFWKNSEIWTPILEDPQSLYHDSAEFLEKIKSSADSLQLPLYLLMDHQTSSVMPRQAALVELVKSGHEKFLFDSKTDEEERIDIIGTKIPALSTFIINNMICESEFKAIRSAQCNWCSYREACGA